MTGQVRTGERGLGPVVGVVLLLAITVMLAGTVGLFAISMDGEAQVGPPTTAFGVDYEPGAGGADAVTISHVGGDDVRPEQLFVVVDGAACRGGPGTPDGRYAGDEWVGAAEMTAGMTLVVDGDSPESHCTGGGTLDLGGATIRVVWVYPDGRSTRLGSWEG